MAMQPTSNVAEDVTITSYKGFNRDWTCRGYQYAIGGSYSIDGDIVVCKTGLHACANPLAVFEHYPPGTSVYAEVQQSGATSHGDNHKIASARLSVTVELSLHEMITRAVKWISDRAKSKTTHDDRQAAASGEQGQAAASGNQGQAVASGNHGAALASGHRGRVMGSAGNALFLVYRDPETSEIKHAWAGIVGGDGIKPGIWYSLNADGLPVIVGAL